MNKLTENLGIKKDDTNLYKTPTNKLKEEDASKIMGTLIEKLTKKYPNEKEMGNNLIVNESLTKTKVFKNLLEKYENRIEKINNIVRIHK